MVEIEILFDDSGSGGAMRQLSVESSKRLSALDQPGSEAFAVIDQRHPDQALFGLVATLGRQSARPPPRRFAATTIPMRLP
jgi:hypothetical protein